MYLRSNDQSGEYKILHLYKHDRSEQEPTFKINPVFIDCLYGRANHEQILHEPLARAAGTSMAISYFGRELEPDEQWILASAVIGVVNGDWRAAMNRYRQWFDGFAHTNRFPNKLTDVFNTGSTGPEWGYRKNNAYNTDPTEWGYKVMGHVAPDHLKKPIDLIEHSGYWEHDEITDAYRTEMEARARKAGKSFTLWPDRHGMLEGKYVYWGNQGDYGLCGYNERWGGLPAFRDYLTAIKEQG